MNYSDNTTFLDYAKSLIQQLKYKTVLVKYGGAAMKDEKLTIQMVKNLIFLNDLGLRCIVVHGGGPNINDWLQKFSIKPQFKNGIRITDSITMEIVQMVLAGQVNKTLVTIFNKYNGNAVGLSGHDSNLIIADPIDKQDNNRVANVGSIDLRIINLLINNNYIPIIAPIGVSKQGLSYNINADLVAGALAEKLKVDVLIILTDTPGILKDHQNKATLYENLTPMEVCKLIEDGIIFGGMLPKVKSCLHALDNGVKVVKIIDGRIDNSLILSFIENTQVGTSILY
uniref:Acetylglutamate kinase n=1 Tax=Trichogloeopsis pedicellata TaxID=1495610 RepID=A0A1G4P0S5_9FLOR|nr:Acetylglutamate kinase [Trichogloeopsis pedicellata]SCW24483.1 Acetylglutamate kinase [Trichogloeopsis pedicellata]